MIIDHEYPVPDFKNIVGCATPNVNLYHFLDAEEDPRHATWGEMSLDDTFTDDHALLSPSTVVCTTAAQAPTLDNFIVSVANLTEVAWKKSALEQLVLNQEYKDLLQAAVKQYSEGLVNASDFIGHKGKGLVIVLHGHPGVGKSLTAEAVAQDAKRPLVPFGIGSVINGDFEVKLKRIFERCARWRAILLIDEADVFLEKRSYEDMWRNGIVSSKHCHCNPFTASLLI